MAIATLDHPICRVLKVRMPEFRQQSQMFARDQCGFELDMLLISFSD